MHSPSAYCISSPFATLASAPLAVGAGAAISSNKRPRLEDLVAPQPPPEAEEEPIKRKLFQRKVALTGQLRTYKILMKPTSAQREEFERCFAVSRLYYNKANTLVKQDASYRNFQKVRNELLAKRHPEWDTGSTAPPCRPREPALSRRVVRSHGAARKGLPLASSSHRPGSCSRSRERRQRLRRHPRRLPDLVRAWRHRAPLCAFLCGRPSDLRTDGTGVRYAVDCEQVGVVRGRVPSRSASVVDAVRRGA